MIYDLRNGIKKVNRHLKRGKMFANVGPEIYCEKEGDPSLWDRLLDSFNVHSRNIYSVEAPKKKQKELNCYAKTLRSR